MGDPCSKSAGPGIPLHLHTPSGQSGIYVYFRIEKIWAEVKVLKAFCG